MIIAIAAAMAVPRMRDSEAIQLRSAAHLLISDLAYTQVESIAHSDDPRMLILGTDNKSYWIAAASQPEVPITNPADRLSYKVTFGQGRAQALSRVTIDSSTIGEDKRLGFRAFGQLDQVTDASITLAAGSMKITITLNAITGQPSVSTLE